MSRKVKNIIMIVLIIVLICTCCLTINFAKNNNINNNTMIQNNDENMPKKPNDNMENPPEKPSEDSNMGAADSNGPPEIPENSNQNDMMDRKDNNMTNIGNQNSSMSLVCYVLFGVQSFVISLLLIYLIMSRFNKKTLKETLSSSDKIVIYSLSIIILTGVLMFIELNVLNKLQSSSSNIGNMNMNENNSNISYSTAYEVTKDKEITNGEYNSTKENENAILVTGNINVNIENANIEKTGDSSSGDNTSFYGINSALLAKSGANLTLKNLNITTDAVGANGVFSYGGSATTKNTSSDGTIITISDSTITTKKDSSGGIMTTGGGTTNAYNLIINTNGISSAAIRTDRGGGVVNVEGGKYTTLGSGSPAIYSTAEINVKNATLISKVAEGIVIEGKNSVVIENCNLTDSNTKLNGLSTTYKNIFLYQSMSGDADTGNSSFTASNSKITTNNGDTFYITNTEATITLNNNEFINNDSNGNFLRAKSDSWGSNGSNGGNVTLNFIKQKAIGKIIVDNISKLDMRMSDNSYYEGSINSENTAQSLILKLDKTSSIKLTGDSYVTSFTNEDSTNSNIDFNGYKLYVKEKAIN